MSENLFNRELISSVVTPRAWRQSLLFAVLFAMEAAACSVILWVGYSLAKAPDLGWAIVSAFLVLQPEFSQSITVALTRVAANLVGAAVGLAVGAAMGVGPVPLIAAIFITSIACGLLRLDAALRTACVAIVIVMNASHGNIVVSGAGRFLSVTIGCMTGVLLQLATLPLTNRWRKSPPPIEKSTE